MAENKQQQQLKEITERLEQGVKELFSSEKYMEYLRVMSQFHNYSFSNTLLIAMQKPNATLVAGYGAWQKKFERNVMKGEKAIKIFAPAPRKVEVEQDMLDPETQKPVIDENGDVKKETVTVHQPFFKITSVFDVSQTDGKPLPELDDTVQDLTASVEGYNIFFEALKRTSTVPMDFEPIEGGSHGFYHQIEKRIAIAEGMSEAQNVKTGIHEIAHSRLHDVDMIDAANGIAVDRRTREVQAESVAYTVCQHYGIDTSEYSFGYIAGWSEGKEIKELRSSMEVIRREADSMIKEIDRNLEEIRKERQAEKSKTAERFEITTYSAPGEDDKFAVWDNEKGDFFIDADNLIHAYDTEAEALEYMEYVKGIGIEKSVIAGYYVIPNMMMPESQTFDDFDTAMQAYFGSSNEKMKAFGIDLNSEGTERIEFIHNVNGIDYPVVNFSDSPYGNNPEVIAVADRVFAALENHDVAIAYTVGDLYFSIQTTDEGYDYTLYDPDYQVLDGGIIENTDKSLTEVITDILDEADLDYGDCRVIDYEDFMLEIDKANAIPVAEAAEPKYTPLYQGYLDVKAEYPDSIVLYQVGDFFEAFNDDAKTIAAAFDLQLTSRPINDTERAALIGLPGHRLESYMDMIRDRGYDVAIASLEDSERKVSHLRSMNKEDPVESHVIGRINYLHPDGRVRESVEYTSEYQFEKDIKEEHSFGVSISVTLYADENGKTVPVDYIFKLDPPLHGTSTILSPYVEKLADPKEEPPRVPLTSENTEPSEALRGHSRAEIEEMVLAHAQAELDDMGLTDSVKLLGARVYGSRTRESLITDKSDIDVVLSYTAPNGEMYEDSFFNILNENGLQIDGLPIDINPISIEETGTLDDYMTRAEAYLDRKELHKQVYGYLEQTSYNADNLIEAAKIAFPEVKGETLKDFIYGAAVQKLREDAEEFDEIEVLDYKGLFSNGRVKPQELPDNLYAYDLRGSDDDPGKFATLEMMVVVNHAGTVILPDRLTQLVDKKHLPIGDDYNFTGDSMTLEQFYETLAPGKGEAVYAKEAKDITEKAIAFYGDEVKLFDYLGEDGETILTDIVEKLNKSYVAYMADKELTAEAERPEPKRFAVVIMDDGADHPYEVWDMEKNACYVGEDGNRAEFMTRWQAEDFASEHNRWVAEHGGIGAEILSPEIQRENAELDAIGNFLDATLIYDITYGFDNGVFSAKDEDTTWTRSEFYDFLVNEVIMLDENEKLVPGFYMPDKVLEPIIGYAKEAGVTINKHSMEKAEPEKPTIVPLSDLTFAEAKEKGEIDAWRASKKETEACSQQFDKEFGMAYHERRMPEFLAEMADKYGIDRVKIVLASTIQLADHDGRYYPSTKADAAKVHIPGTDTEDYSKDVRRYYATNCHPVMVNSAFRELQKMERDKGKAKDPTAVDNDKPPRASVLSRLQEKQKQVKASPTKNEDRKRGIEI